MNTVSLLVIGIALSVDSLAASITAGACTKCIRIKQILKIAAFMAIFQGAMPLVGWLIGSSFKHVIQDYDHWVAFILLAGIGGKLIYDGIKNDSNLYPGIKTTRNLVLAGIALATSIDALILGIGFGLIQINIWHAMLIIGSITFLFSIIGVFVGDQLGKEMNKGIEIFGGTVLLGLGVKILTEHLYF